MIPQYIVKAYLQNKKAFIVQAYSISHKRQSLILVVTVESFKICAGQFLLIDIWFEMLN